MIMRERSNDNYNEARKSSKTSQAKIKLDSREDYYPEIQEIMDYLRDTSLHILQKDIENRIEQEGRRAQEYDDTVVSNTLSIIGPKSRTYAELMNIIDNMEQVTKEEYESAATELETCYSCFVGDYIPPKQKRKTVKSVKRATKRSTNKRQSS